MKIPLLNIPVVYHRGTLDKADKRSFNSISSEGDGLSVSLCPDTWNQIWHLYGPQGQNQTHSLTLDTAQYIDYYSIDQETRSEIIQWAEQEGYAQRKMVN
jgi:hypothetical protein